MTGHCCGGGAPILTPAWRACPAVGRRKVAKVKSPRSPPSVERAFGLVFLAFCTEGEGIILVPQTARFLKLWANPPLYGRPAELVQFGKLPEFWRAIIRGHGRGEGYRYPPPEG